MLRIIKAINPWYFYSAAVCCKKMIFPPSLREHMLWDIFFLESWQLKKGIFPPGDMKVVIAKNGLPVLSFCALTAHNFQLWNLKQEHNSGNGKIIIMCSRKDKFAVYKSWTLIFSRSLIHSKTWNNYIVKNNWISVLVEILAVKDYFCEEGFWPFGVYICILVGLFFPHCSSRQWHIFKFASIIFPIPIPCPPTSHLSQMLGYLTLHIFVESLLSWCYYWHYLDSCRGLQHVPHPPVLCPAHLYYVASRET